MDRRRHRPNETKHLRKPYYFSEWDYCRPCGHLQHYERFKVYNPPPEKRDVMRESGAIL
jgi:hypothetical protein